MGKLNFLEPSEPLQASNGTDLPLPRLTITTEVNTTYSLFFYPEDGDDNSPKPWYISTKLHDVISHKALQLIMIYIPNIPFHDLQLKMLVCIFNIQST